MYGLAFLTVGDKKQVHPETVCCISKHKVR